MSSTRVHHGSCLCGDIKYQIRLTLPPVTEPDQIKHKGTRFYKCNCRSCVKIGMFHCRPVDVPNDFVLTSPANPDDIARYNSFGGDVNWYFCKKCGVRMFGGCGRWVQEELDVKKWAGEDGGGNILSQVWKLQAVDGKKLFDGGPFVYVTVNAITLDDLDLVELHKKGWICYYENRVRKGSEPLQSRYSEPFPGGCF